MSTVIIQMEIESSNRVIGKGGGRGTLHFQFGLEICWGAGL